MFETVSLIHMTHHCYFMFATNKMLKMPVQFKRLLIIMRWILWLANGTSVLVKMSGS